MSRFTIGGVGNSEGPYKFTTLPTTEADVGNNDLVWEFTGGAATNETAVRGENVSLTGADLVLTQNGGIAAASGGGRPVANDSYQYFTATLPFWNKFLPNPGGFSMLWQSKNHAEIVGTAQLWLAYLRFDSGVYHEPIMNPTHGLLEVGWKGLSSRAAWKSESTGDLLPMTGTTWILMSHDPVNNLGFLGLALGNNQPEKLANFGWFDIIRGNLSPLPTINSFYNGTRNAIVGGSSTLKSFGQTICSISARLGPCVFKD
ncbi:MAG: hypothetical protein JEY79_03975 [Pseudodesulfovibrio sp.]|nr:hypothetical protein [Pseudodesulfovibrio sp.]